jgi:hypothetical protein
LRRERWRGQARSADSDFAGRLYNLVSGIPSDLAKTQFVKSDRLLDVPLRTEVFATRESWQAYAVKALHSVAELAKEFGIEKHLHLWPDKSLGSQSLANRMQNPDKYLRRLEHWWHRVSEWPK